jgi:hypothetical protein
MVPRLSFEPSAKPWDQDDSTEIQIDIEIQYQKHLREYVDLPDRESMGYRENVAEIPVHDTAQSCPADQLWE